MLDYRSNSEVKFLDQPARRPFSNISFNSIGIIVAVLDLVLVALASIAAGVFYHILVHNHVGDIAAFLTIGYISGVVFVLLMKSRGLYQPSALISAEQQYWGVIFAWTVVLLSLSWLLFLLKISLTFSRGSTIGFGVLGLVLLFGFRALITTTLQRAFASGAVAGRRAILIGSGAEFTSSSALPNLAACGVREVARFELPASTDPAQSVAASDDKVIERAILLAQVSHVDDILLALPWAEVVRRDRICDRLRVLPIPIVLLPDRFVSSMRAERMIQIGSLAALELQRAPLSHTELALKRTIDLVLSATLLVLFSPLLLVVSLAIKSETRGPIIFKQRRRGFNGRDFIIYKFRTMTVLEDGEKIRQSTPGDARVTRIGRMLRATSIDELPQLINAFRGDMSIVGPRPHAVAHDREFGDSIANYAFRQHVKPGITGWAQVNGFRGQTPQLEIMERRVEFDLWYINNWSIWLDLWIMIRTGIEVARGRNAH